MKATATSCAKHAIHPAVLLYVPRRRHGRSSIRGDMTAATGAGLRPGLESEFGPLKDAESFSEDARFKPQIGVPYCFRAEYHEGFVQKVQVLSSEGVPRKVHVEIQLPHELQYQAGDHLVILPLNSWQTVQRVLSRFHLGWDSILNVLSGGPTGLSLKNPISAADLLSGYVELGQLVTPNILKTLASRASDSETAECLLQLSPDHHESIARRKGLTILEILEKFPSIPVNIEEYLQWLAPLRLRLYTISSSPGMTRRHATLTVSVAGDPGLSTSDQSRGVASNYLLESSPGTALRIALRNPNPAFRLPVDPSAQPVIMIASGSGISPFRAFSQEICDQRQVGVRLAPAYLFFGCRGLNMDDLYRSEFDAFEEDGIVTVFRAFSQAPSDTHDCRYVQDRLRREKEIVKKLWDQDAVIFVCGGMKMNNGVKETLLCQVCSSDVELSSPRYVAEVFT